MTDNLEIIKKYFNKPLDTINISDIDNLFSDKNDKYIKILQTDPGIIDELLRLQTVSNNPNNDVISILTPISYQIHLQYAWDLHSKYMDEDNTDNYLNKLKELEQDKDIFVRIIGYLEDLYVFGEKGYCKDLHDDISKDLEVMKNYACDLINSGNLDATFYLITEILDIIFKINSKYTALFSKNVVTDNDDRFMKALSLFYAFELKLIEKHKNTEKNN